MNVCLALSALLLAAPLSAMDFDAGIDAAAALSAARTAVKDGPALRVAGGQVANIWNRTDSEDVTLEPGRSESAYVDMDSAVYRTVCETPSPYVGPICRDEVMFRDVRRFKLVLTAPLPADWGKQTFRLRLDAMRRPTLSIEALDKKRTYAFKLPEFYEDVLLVTPQPAEKSAGLVQAGLTVCTLRDIVKDQCVYGCPDGKEIRKPVAEPPALACPQILIPF